MPDFSQRTDSLAAADAALQLAFEGSGIGFWYHDFEAGRAWHSAGLRQVLGHDAEAAEIDPYFHVHPEDAELLRAVEADMASGAITQFEYEIRARHRDGQYHWMLCRGHVAERDGAGRAVRLIGTAVDISRRKQAEAARDASHAILQTVIESMPNIVFWKDRNGRYRGCNSAFARTLGLEVAAVVGRTDLELPWSEEIRRNILGTDALILRGELELRNDLRESRLDHLPRAALVSSVPLRDAAGAIDGFVGLIVDIADANAAQSVIRRSEERWNQALACTGTAVWEVEFQTGAMYHSPFLAVLLGFGPDEFEWTANSATEFAHPDDRAEVERQSALVNSGAAETLDHEIRLRCRDGSYKWVLARGGILGRKPGSGPPRFIGTLTDISRLKQAEIAAESSRALLRNIIDAIPHSIFWKNGSGVYLGCNTAFARVAGRSTPDEIVGLADADLHWSAERLMSIRELDGAVLRGERVAVNLPVEILTAAGIVHRLATVLPFHFSGAQLAGTIGIVIDITELQRARESAQLAEQRWQTVLESSGAGVWEIDMQSGTVHRSPHLCAMLGYGPDEIDDDLESQHILVHPDDVAASQSMRARVEAGETDVIEVEYRLRCADGSYRWMLSRGAVIARDAGGKPTRLVGTHTDINDEYEGRDRAAQARKLESLGNLAAGVAHEINTPLQFVSDSLSFLRGGFDDIVRLAAGTNDPAIGELCEQVPRALDLVQEGIARIAEIVRAMRVYSHPDSHAKEPANVDDLLRNALAMARHEYKHVADIRTDFSNPPVLPCYPGELSQVFVNLLVNAAHAIAVGNQDGAARGLITLRSALTHGAVVVEIEDTGCGIPAANLERVFEPFFTTKPLGQGTGQGLSLARTVIEQHHGGRISVASQLGRGTVMRIVLPRQETLAQAAA